MSTSGDPAAKGARDGAMSTSGDPAAAPGRSIPGEAKSAKSAKSEGAFGDAGAARGAVLVPPDRLRGSPTGSLGSFPTG